MGDKTQSKAMEDKLDTVEEKIDQREAKEQEAKRYVIKKIMSLQRSTTCWQKIFMPLWIWRIK